MTSRRKHSGIERRSGGDQDAVWVEFLGRNRRGRFVRCSQSLFWIKENYDGGGVDESEETCRVRHAHERLHLGLHRHWTDAVIEMLYTHEFRDNHEYDGPGETRFYDERTGEWEDDE